MTLKELRARAAELNIKGRSKMDRATLELAIGIATQEGRVLTGMVKAEDLDLTSMRPEDNLPRPQAVPTTGPSPHKTEAQRKRARAVRRARRARINRRGY